MHDLAIKISSAKAGETHLFSTGQAGYIVKSASGQLLGIDLYLSDFVERLEGHMGYKRMLPKVLGVDEIVFDVLIATHAHGDHFDRDAIPGLMGNGGKRTKLYCSAGCEALIKQTQLEYYRDNIVYVKPGDSYIAGDYRIAFVNCDHGISAPDAVGVVAEVDGKRIYEAGDTCLRLDRVREIKAFGELDVLIAPINGAYGNLNEEECVQLSAELNPKLTIPCHYGMFASHGGNPGKFFDIMTEKNPGSAMIIMTQGEQVTLQNYGMADYRGI